MENKVSQVIVKSTLTLRYVYRSKGSHRTSFHTKDSKRTMLIIVSEYVKKKTRIVINVKSDLYLREPRAGPNGPVLNSVETWCLLTNSRFLKSSG